MEKDQVFFWSVLLFVVGILCGSFFSPPFVLLSLAGSAFFIALIIVFPKKEIIFSGLFFLAWSGGGMLAWQERSTLQSLPHLAEPVRGEVRIVADPEERDFFQRTVVRYEACESGQCPKTRVVWQAPLSFTGEAGTRLAFACRLEQPKNFVPDFDYRMFLAKDGIGYICTQADQATVLEPDVPGKLRALLYVPKHAFESVLSQILTEPEAGLAKGLLLGGDHYLPKALKDDFTKVGLSHMIAVSGYNIMLIAQMLLVLGLGLGLWRRQAIWAALIGIVFFIVMIGMPASAARAGAMASVVFIALQTGRLAQPINALLFAGGVMLFWNPLLLRYDLGFQLSFLATLGILWVMPYYERFAPQGLILKKSGEILVMTLAVELFVLPIILFAFHTVSPLIIVGNFLVILVPFAMATAFVAALLFLVLPGAHIVVAWGAFGILTLITRGVEWLGERGGNITVEDFRVFHLVLWYILLGVFVTALHRYFSARPYGWKQKI